MPSGGARAATYGRVHASCVSAALLCPAPGLRTHALPLTHACTHAHMHTCTHAHMHTRMFVSEVLPLLVPPLLSRTQVRDTQVRNTQIRDTATL